MVTREAPSREVDWMNSMPSMPEMRSSMIWVTRVSTTFAGAPDNPPTP